MIAIDVMGGDLAPKAQLIGALRAAKSGIAVCLFGPKDQVKSMLGELDLQWGFYPIEISDAQEVIEMSEEPVLAVRKKTQSSMVLAVKSVASGKCKAVLSAGNSGALMAASAFILGRKPGIERPAIAGFLPAFDGSVLCLDLGANTDCKPHYLLQFAYLGKSYISSLRGISNPKIGLLANGEESSKGSILVKDAHILLSGATDLNFIGNVEPADVCNRVADVVICDGFAGNILLKTAESVSSMIYEWAQKKLTLENSEWGTSFSKEIFDRTSWRKAGGAVLLGVNGNVVVAHGKACEATMENAIRFAHEMAQNDSLLKNTDKFKEVAVQ